MEKKNKATKLLHTSKNARTKNRETRVCVCAFLCILLHFSFIIKSNHVFLGLDVTEKVTSCFTRGTLYELLLPEIVPEVINLKYCHYED